MFYRRILINNLKSDIIKVLSKNNYNELLKNGYIEIDEVIYNQVFNGS